MILPSVITAGPRGNKCRNCEEKTKAPDVLLRVTTEFNRFSGHMKMDNYCPICGKKELEKAIATLKKMQGVLEHGPSDESDLGSRKVRSV